MYVCTHVQQWEMFPKIGREGGLEWEGRDGEKEGGGGWSV